MTQYEEHMAKVRAEREEQRFFSELIQSYASAPAGFEAQRKMFKNDDEEY